MTDKLKGTEESPRNEQGSPSCKGDVLKRYKTFGINPRRLASVKVLRSYKGVSLSTEKFKK